MHKLLATLLWTPLSVNLISDIVHLEILAFIVFPVYCILYFGTYCYKKSEEDFEKKFWATYFKEKAL